MLYLIGERVIIVSIFENLIGLKHYSKNSEPVSYSSYNGGDIPIGQNADKVCAFEFLKLFLL